MMGEAALPPGPFDPARTAGPQILISLRFLHARQFSARLKTLSND
jgi:hypothetical protein